MSRAGRGEGGSALDWVARVDVGSCILCDVYKSTGVQILFILRALRREETDALQY